MNTFPLWRFDLFLDVPDQGAKALGGQKNKPNKTMGEGKKENRTCNVRFFMSSNLCLSCVQQTLQILRRKL